MSPAYGKMNLNQKDKTYKKLRKILQARYRDFKPLDGKAVGEAGGWGRRLDSKSLHPTSSHSQ